MIYKKEIAIKQTHRTIESGLNDSIPKYKKKYKHDTSKLIKRLSKKISEQ